MSRLSKPQHLHQIARDAAARGIALLKQGNDVAAAELLSMADKALPNDPTIIHALGVVDFRAGRVAHAERRLLRALHLLPAATTHYDLGCVYLQAGNTGAAHDHFLSATKLKPDHVEAWVKLALTYRSQRELESSKQCLRKVLQLNSAHQIALKELSKQLHEDGRLREAVDLWRNAVNAHATKEDLHIAFGQFLLECELNNEALTLYQAAASRFPNSAPIHSGLAQTLENLGSREDAEALYRTALAIDAHAGYALGGLLNLLGSRADDSLISRATDVLGASNLSNSVRSLVGYGLGKAQEAKGQYEAAFRAWMCANEARRADQGSLDRRALTELVDAIVRVFQPTLLRQHAAAASTDDRPLFVVGMPRSGTTLTERIIAAHPLAVGLGELAEIGQMPSRLPARAGTLLPWPQCLHVIDSQYLREAAQEYSAHLSERVSAPSLRIVDKAPLNFFHVGLIALLYPSAHIVWCRRDPRDVCLSIFSESFGLSQRYATGLEDLAVFYHAHLRLMRHWQELLPGQIRVLQYERLVQDFDTEARNLLEHVGLPWDDNCAEFYTDTSTVSTPSRWQVRKPIYASSIGRWRRYEPWLAPLLSALGNVDAC